MPKSGKRLPQRFLLLGHRLANQFGEVGYDNASISCAMRGSRKFCQRGSNFDGFFCLFVFLVDERWETYHYKRSVLTFDDFYQTFQKSDVAVENQPSANVLSKSSQAVSKSLAQNILTEEFSSEVCSNCDELVDENFSQVCEMCNKNCHTKCVQIKKMV